MKYNNICSIFVIFSVINLSIQSNQYSLINPTYTDSTQTHIKGELKFNDNEEFKREDFQFSQMKHLDKIEPIKSLSLDLSIEYDNILHLKIDDSQNKRWACADKVLNNKYFNELDKHQSKFTFDNFGIKRTDSPFSFDLFNPNNESEVFYSFSKDNFLFSDRFILFESYLTSNDIYGYGERGHEFKLGNGVFTIYPNDTGGIQQDDGAGGMNGYGHHPIGLHKTKFPNKFLGFAFINSNCMDIVISDTKNNPQFSHTLQHRTIGGIIDFYIVIDTTPENVIKKLKFLLGFPTLQPYWSFGWHHSRYGYKSDRQFEDVYNNYISHEIPIDTMWIDIDSLDNFKIFSLNTSYFSRLPSIVDNLHKKNAHFVPIVDLGISYTQPYNEFIKIGKELSCFIKSNYTKKELISKVWPGDTVFPDFFNPNTTLLWHYGLKTYEDIVHFDGIWLDMNEPAMLERNPHCIGEIATNCQPKDNYYYYDDLPYLPGFYYNRHSDLGTKSINENAIAYGKDERMFAMYNIKPLIPYLESKATYEYLYYSNKRPFILTRSSFIGNGKYAAHWLGDNFSRMESLINSIHGIFSFNIFGMPMTGDDICGFLNNASDMLCARWHNLGAFYPFSRNHNFFASTNQEPWEFRQYTLPTAKNVIRLRYSLIRYIYSQMFLVSLNELGSFFKPVLFEYPEESNSYEDIGKKIMFGDSFLLIPNTNLNENNITAKFPNDNWNEFPSGKPFLNKNDENRNNVVLSGNYSAIHLFMRGGKITLWQDTLSKYYTNSYTQKKECASKIIINPNESNTAEGTFFYDRDETNVITKKTYIRVTFNYTKNTLTISSVNYRKISYDFEDININEILLLRAKENIQNVKELKKVKIYLKGKDEGEEITTISYDEENEKLSIKLDSKKISLEEIVKVEYNE